MTFQNIESKAMKLPPKDRGKLALALLESLDEADPTEIEHRWLAEAERRYRAFRGGRTKTTPAKEAIARARKALRP